MVHRRVYEAVGGYDRRYPLANDFDFWLRPRRASASATAPGARWSRSAATARTPPTSHGRAREIDDVERALEAALERHTLRELVPELDWAVLDPREGERQALLRLADALESRLLPLPGLAARLRERAACHAAPAQPRRPRARERPPAAADDDRLRLEGRAAAARPFRAWPPRSWRGAAGR